VPRQKTILLQPGGATGGAKGHGGGSPFISMRLAERRGKRGFTV
jgi:hypothetical protein